MKTRVLCSLICLSTIIAVAAPPSADQVLSEVKAKAAADNKAIFVHFGASWCGWCKRLEAFLGKPEVKAVFEKHFVPVKLVVQESEKNKALENAGSAAVLKRFGGPAGLPFSAFLDREGKLIVNSNRNGDEGQNIGHPIQPEEVDWFVAMMKKAAPKISEADLRVIETALRNQER